MMRACLLDEPAPPHLMDESAMLPTATGRGLAVVSGLASSWGWYPEPGGGKVVWAELGPDASGEEAAETRPAKMAGRGAGGPSAGRFISEEDLAAAQRLADEAGNALAQRGRAPRNGGAHEGA
jgi:hypothetical protein